MKGKLIGDIFLVKDAVDDPHELLKIPGVKRIVRIGSISGQLREPHTEVIWGEGTETVHRENKVLFKLDVAKVMWSKGNSAERMRIPQLVSPGEVLVDLFAGIGYFSIPTAVHANPKQIYALELNPVSYHYLKENIILNKVEDSVIPILGDCREKAPRGLADRVFMGYIGNTQDYLPVAMKVLKDEGVIHYHESVPDKIKFERPIKRIKESAGNRDVDILNQRVIKKYSPGVCHVVIDARIGGE